MSIDRCSRCSELVDTDEEPEAYVDVSNQRRGPEDWQCFCRRCRERREDEIGQEPPDREFSPAQQAIIDAAEADSEEPK